jgi:hypothetical protein
MVGWLSLTVVVGLAHLVDRILAGNFSNTFTGNSLTVDVLASWLGSRDLCATHVLVCYPAFQINKVP